MCVVVTAVVMLTSTKTEAQNPTWELYGTDLHIKYVKRHYGLFNLFWRWRWEEYNKIKVYEPGGDIEGDAIKRVYYGYERNNPEHYNYVHSSHAKTVHLNSGDPNFENEYDFHWVCGIEKRQDQPEKKYPAVGMEAKAHVVGTITEHVSGASNKEKYKHTTYLKVTAQHKTGGTKDFTVTVTYQVEGGYGRTKISKQISLAPGESTTMKLSVPGNREWANIISIDVRENRPLEIPQPPRFMQPIDSPPPPSPPGLPIIRPRSAESN